MESLGFFHLGDFSRETKLKPFYIKFPKMIETRTIPYYINSVTFYPKRIYWFHVELYWSSYNLSNIFQKKNLKHQKVTRLDRKVQLLLSMEDIHSIDTLEFYYKYYIHYDKNEMLNSIKNFINIKIINDGWRFHEYQSNVYDELGN